MLKKAVTRILAATLALSLAFPNVGNVSYAAQEQELLTQASAEASADASLTEKTEEDLTSSDLTLQDAADGMSVDSEEEVSGDTSKDPSGNSPEDENTVSGESSEVASDAVSFDESKEEDTSEEDTSGEDASEEASEAGSLMSAEEDDALVGESSDETDSESEEILEFHVGPGYKYIYTDEDVEESLRSEYTEEELCPEIPEGEELLVTASTGGLKGAMRSRKTSYSYSSSSFNPQKDVANALREVSEADELDPTGGDYIKGNLIGYSASGRGSGGSCNITITFKWANYGNAANEEAAVDTKVKEIVSELDLDSNSLSEFEKVSKIHGYLVNSITYTDDGKYGCHGTYAALVNKRCVCQGYANAFTRLTREAGIASKYIVGLRINHAWNMVRVHGGTDPERPWYNNDATWGDFLLNELDFADHPADDEYETDSFVSAHPVSRYSWGKSEVVLRNLNNISMTFPGIDGEELTTSATGGRPKMVLFYDSTDTILVPGDIKALAQSSVVSRGHIDVIAIDMKGNDSTKVTAFKNKYAKGSRIRFAAATQDQANEAMQAYMDVFSYYVDGGVIYAVLIDDNDKVQLFLSNDASPARLSRRYMPYLKEGYDPEAYLKSLEIRRFANSEAMDGNTYSVIKNGGSVSIKFGEKLYLKGVGIPSKDGITGFKDTSSVNIEGSGEVLYYDPSGFSFEGTDKGTATVTFVSDYDDYVTSKITVKVLPALITAISFDRQVMNLPVDAGSDSEKTLTLNYTPDPTTDSKDAAFTVSDENILAIEKTGESTVKVKAVGIGSATVTAKCMGKTATCRVTTYRKVNSVRVISGSVTSLYVGEYAKLSYGITPSDATVTKAAVWSSSGSHLSINPAEDGDSCTVTAKAPGTQTVTATVEDESGSLSLKVYSPNITLNANGGALPAGVSDEVYVTFGKALGDLPVPTKSGNIFMGWYTGENMSGTKVTSSSVASRALLGDPSGAGLKLYAGWKEFQKEEITIAEIEDAVYTGGAIKPSVAVYYEDRLLTVGVDYTVSYKNNKNAFILEDGYDVSKAPTVTVKGKGNFTGQAASKYFNIRPRKLTESDITVDTSKLTLTANGKAQKAVPSVKMGKLALKKNKDILYIYPGKWGSVGDDISDEAAEDGDYINPGRYAVYISAVEGGNYEGVISVSETILRKDITKVSKLSISLSKKSFVYTGDKIEPEVLVKSGKTVLTEGTDYNLIFTDNKEIGTAAVTVVGIGAFTGTKKLTFKITGTNIKGADVSFANSSFTYDGADHMDELGISVRLKKTDTDFLVENTDYIVTGKAVDKGKAVISITGIGRYTGTIKKTVTINPASIDSALVEASDSSEMDGDGYITATYVKGGVKPEVVVKVGGSVLTLNKDYTLKYGNNNAAFTAKEGTEAFEERSGSRKAPFITVTGKGNYKGTRKVFFAIRPSALTDTTENVKITAADVNYNKAAGKWKSSVAVYDTNSKKLGFGTDLNKEIEFTYVGNAVMTDGTTRNGGTAVDSKDSPAVGTTIRATVTGKGNYEGSRLTVEYRIIDRNKNISSGITFKIPDQTYTGDEITLSESNITFVVGKGREDFDINCFEIVEGSYVSNKNKGTAKVTLRGKGTYGGTKTVTFKIVARQLQKKGN
ncbi:MAG: hypothetical protein E7307_03710 [Butyrivibrio sp.]|nr:hypothetical protein [Butyrivibrio sp.]